MCLQIKIGHRAHTSQVVDAVPLSCVCLQIKIGHRAHTSQVVDAVPVSCVCLQIKIGHRAHTSQVVDAVPVLGTRGIHTPVCISSTGWTFTTGSGRDYITYNIT